MKREAVFYHNRRCSKSREALRLLEERGVNVKVIEYLKSGISKQEVLDILKALNAKPIDIIREKELQELGLNKNTKDSQLIDAIIKHPKILQRPILIINGKGVIGRPSERVLELL